jgi:hypothetical protein
MEPTYIRKNKKAGMLHRLMIGKGDFEVFFIRVFLWVKKLIAAQ